jgi:hypothetical protein
MMYLTTWVCNVCQHETFGAMGTRASEYELPAFVPLHHAVVPAGVLGVVHASAYLRAAKRLMHVLLGLQTKADCRTN